jgi:hypothetical protein
VRLCYHPIVTAIYSPCTWTCTCTTIWQSHHAPACLLHARCCHSFQRLCSATNAAAAAGCAASQGRQCMPLGWWLSAGAHGCTGDDVAQPGMHLAYLHGSYALSRHLLLSHQRAPDLLHPAAPMALLTLRRYRIRMASAKHAALCSCGRCTQEASQLAGSGICMKSHSDYWNNDPGRSCSSCMCLLWQRTCRCRPSALSCRCAPADWSGRSAARQLRWAPPMRSESPPASRSMYLKFITSTHKHVKRLLAIA